MRNILEDNNIYASYKNSLILEFTEAALKKVIEKFKKENTNLTDDMIIAYADIYEQLKNTPRFTDTVNRLFPNKVKNPKDIFTFTWEQLETSIDNLTEVKNIGAVDKSKYKTAYEDDEILIILGRDADEWKNIINLVATLPPFKIPTWCIAKSSYYYYRKDNRTGQTRSQYYIHSKKPTPSPKYQNSVLMISNDGQYQLTSQNNDGDHVLEWSKIVHLIPELKGKQEYIKYYPLSKKENMDLDIEKATADDFYRLPYAVKRAYVQNGKQIYIEDFIAIDKELQNTYINARFDRHGFSLYTGPHTDRYTKNFFATPSLKTNQGHNHPQGDLDDEQAIDLINQLLGDVTIEQRFEIYKASCLYITEEFSKFPQAIKTFQKQCEKHLTKLKTALIDKILRVFNVTNFSEQTDVVKFTLCEIPDIFITYPDFIKLPYNAQVRYIQSRKTLRHLVFLFFTQKMIKEFNADETKRTGYQQNYLPAIEKAWKNNTVTYRQVVDIATIQGQKQKGKGITYLLNFNKLPGDTPLRGVYASKVLEKIKEENE